MKTKFTPPTEEEIATRKRLRLICEWFAGLNHRIVNPPDQGLPKEVLQEIAAKNFDAGDLMAIRDRPHHWTRSNPYQWLWILHRYQNL